MVFFLPFLIVAAKVAVCAAAAGGAAYGGYKTYRAVTTVNQTRETVEGKINDRMSQGMKVVDRLNELNKFFITLLEKLQGAVEDSKPYITDLFDVLSDWSELFSAPTGGIGLKRAGQVYLIILAVSIVEEFICDIDILNQILENRLALTLAALHVENTDSYRDAAKLASGILGIPAMVILLQYLRDRSVLLFYRLVFFAGVSCVLCLTFFVFRHRTNIYVGLSTCASKLRAHFTSDRKRYGKSNNSAESFTNKTKKSSAVRGQFTSGRLLPSK